MKADMVLSLKDRESRPPMPPHCPASCCRWQTVPSYDENEPHCPFMIASWTLEDIIEGATAGRSHRLLVQA